MIVNFKELEDYLNKFGYPYNENMKSDTFEIPDQTAYEYLMSNIKKYENVDAMTFYNKKIKYYKLKEEIEKTANAMKGIGMSDGDRIGTLIPNIPEITYMQYGTSKIGSVPSNIDPLTSGKMLLNYVRNEHLKNIVVVDVMYESAIRPIEHELKEQFGIDKIIVVPATNSLPVTTKTLINLKNKINHSRRITSDVLDIIYWNDMIKNTRYEHASNVGFKPDRDAVIEHTSGTSSGIPTSVPLTNENVNAFVEKMKVVYEGKYPYGTKMLNILPYFASYGAINVSHQALNLGFTLQQIPEFKFSDFGYIISKEKSELVMGTPTWFYLATKDERLKKDAFKKLSMAMAGGEKEDDYTWKEILKFFKSHGAKHVTKGHGMTELGGSGCFQFEGYENSRGVGIPAPYDKYIVLDNDGNIVPMTKDGVKGNVWIYSPSATNGIFDGKKIIETKNINGFTFINSKDTMLIMPNNEIMFLEREDRKFPRFDGHKIIPIDIEEKFTSNKLVKQCMVVPYHDDDVGGKMPAAYVVPIKELSTDEMDNIVTNTVNSIVYSSKLNSRDVPRKICFLTELPTTQLSKNDYRSLSNRTMDGSEYTVDIKETNLSVLNIDIIPPRKNIKWKILKLN